MSNKRKPLKPLDYIPSATILEEQLAESQADVSRLETLLRIRRELEAVTAPLKTKIEIAIQDGEKYEAELSPDGMVTMPLRAFERMTEAQLGLKLQVGQLTRELQVREASTE